MNIRSSKLILKDKNTQEVGSSSCYERKERSSKWRQKIKKTDSIFCSRRTFDIDIDIRAHTIEIRSNFWLCARFVATRYVTPLPRRAQEKPDSRRLQVLTEEWKFLFVCLLLFLLLLLLLLLLLMLLLLLLLILSFFDSRSASGWIRSCCWSHPVAEKKLVLTGFSFAGKILHRSATGRT